MKKETFYLLLVIGIVILGALFGCYFQKLMLLIVFWQYWV